MVAFVSSNGCESCCQSGGRPPKSHDTLGQRKTYVHPDAHLRLLYNLALDSYGSSLIEYLSSLLKMRILEAASPVVALPMVVPYNTLGVTS